MRRTVNCPSSAHPRASRPSRSVPEDYFGEEIAARYDASEEQDPMFSPEAINPVVDFLAELAGDGLALELGIGTGRIALPPVCAPSQGRTRST